MTNTIEARILGSQLKRARTSLGLSIPTVSSSIGIDENDLIKWENDESEPSVELLRELARVYHRSTDYFLRITPALPQHINFRLTKQNQLQELPLQTREMIVRFDELCRNETELEKLLGKTRMTRIKREESSLSPEQLSSRVRTLYNLGDKPINDIRKLLLKLGIHVFTLPIEEKKLSGISWWHNEYGPCILVNYFDEPFGRRSFTMAHELAHLIRGGFPTICDLEFNEPEEKFANLFASCFLIPADDLKTYFRLVVGPLFTLPDYKQLGILASRYKVSLEALSRRLENLELIREGSTDKYIAEWNAIPRRIRGAKGPRWKRQLGNHYVSLALNAYSRGNISLGKLAQYLGLDARTAFEFTQKQSEDE